MGCRSGVGGYTRDGERSVEVLADLSDYPIRDGPSVNPNERMSEIGAFGDDGGAEDVDGVDDEVEVIVVAGEEAFHVLVRAWAMEPPL